MSNDTKKPREFFVNPEDITADRPSIFSKKICVIEKITYDRLRAQCEGLASVLKFVKAYDVYPDLSSYKYQVSYELIRPVVIEALKKYEEHK